MEIKKNNLTCSACSLSDKQKATNEDLQKYPTKGIDETD